MLRVLAYHRIAEPDSAPAVDDRNISATPSAFREQMRYVARHYQCVSIPEVLDAIKRGRKLPGRSVLITFDDAYRDFAETAWPILRQLHLTATVFVPTGFPDHPERVFWWDRLHQAFRATRRVVPLETPLGRLPMMNPSERMSSLRAVQRYVVTVANEQAMNLVDSLCDELHEGKNVESHVMGWNQLRELAACGVALGSHTRMHPLVPSLSPERIRDEIRGSQQDLEREVGAALPIFCYPNGNHSEVVARILEQEGIKLAFTTIPSLNNLSASSGLLQIGRTSITPRTSPVIFTMRLLGVGVRLDRWRHRKLEALLTRNSPELQTSRG